MFFLDEPTSGLDPATGAALVRTLRALADAGATVVFTTHAAQDLVACDRVLFLAAGGRLAYDGAPSDALEAFGVDGWEGVYAQLGEQRSAEQWRENSTRSAPSSRPHRARRGRRPRSARSDRSGSAAC